MSTPKPFHTPILVDELLDITKNTQLHTVIDATVGAGGHLFALLENHPEIQKAIAFDQDIHALNISRERLKPFESKVIFVNKNFNEIDTLDNSIKADLIFADIGVSSMQLDTAERGMSFNKLGPLDMRMNTQDNLTAEIIVNQWSQEKLEKIFKEFGEEPRWRLAAKIICEERSKKAIKTTLDLVNVLKPYIKSVKKIHPLTLIFQGLRIAVNRELEVLASFLPKAVNRLNPQGKIGIITFHSLEDRIVKNYFRTISGYKGGREASEFYFEESEPLIEILTKKPICPNDAEIAINPRARSAKMRFAQKI